MTTFISRLAGSGPGLAVAVKDLIDVAGVPTTCGSRSVADSAGPAVEDAACLREIRRRTLAGEVWIVGKTNLHELAYGTTGINPWFGTPTNPLGAHLVPGGSSSGSAVAVAVGDADVALGTDTGGSVRIPAACCGVAGLKTTWGRIPTSGVWPLAPSLDSVGPMARDVAGLVAGMALLEPSFVVPAVAPDGVNVGRLRLVGESIDPVVEDAVDAALRIAELGVEDVPIAGWVDAWSAADVVLSAEAWRIDGALLRDRTDGIGALTAARIAAGEAVTVEQEATARRAQLDWQKALDLVFGRFHVLALPTLLSLPPALDPVPVGLNRATLPVNLAGLPALALPVPAGAPGGLPASLQLVGPADSEELLLAVGARVEAAIR